MGGRGWLVHDGGCIATATYMGIGYGSVRKSVEGYCLYLQPPDYPILPCRYIAMYLTLCAMLLRCLAMRLAGWGVCDVRWIAGGMCDPELLSTTWADRNRGLEPSQPISIVGREIRSLASGFLSGSTLDDKKALEGRKVMT